MRKRILIALLLAFIANACASTPQPTVAPAQTAESATETESTQWWREAVFYEIFVRSFQDSDQDGIGDFNGITQRLDYLQDLGVNAIWLMPIHPSPSYHGYDVINYYAVNREYGSMDDFKNLLNEAHKRNMHIIIDLVINHTSDQHPWFRDANTNIDSPYRDFYVWADSPGAGSWHTGGHGYYYGFFWSGMPDLNYKNPNVTRAIFEISDFWLNKIGVDGFRMDAIKHLIEDGDKLENTPATHEWLKEFYAAYKTQNPQAYTVGEVYGAGSTTINQYTGDQMDHIFNFEIASGILNSANSGAASGINSAMKFAVADTPEFNFATFITNHDQNRSMTVFRGNLDKAKTAAFLLLSLPGTPFIYYGEEIGMQGQKPDEDIRLPMQWNDESNGGFSSATPWRALNADYPQVNVTRELNDPASLLNTYKILLSIRNAHPALKHGRVYIINTGNAGIFSVLLRSERENILLVANLTDAAISEYSLALADKDSTLNFSGTTVLFGGEIEISQPAALTNYKPAESLPAYAKYLIQLNP